MTEGADADDMHGREAVRVHFVQRLAGSGLRRGKGLTEADHADMLRRLVDYLAYLSPASLMTLADQVLQVATGPKRDQWPTELLIRQMAAALERRPFEQAPIVASWLASIEGPQAEAGGYLVALYRHLRRHPRPLMPYDRQVIHRQAGEDARQMQLIRERIDCGTAGAEDRRWMVEWLEDERQARNIVDRGQAARRAKQGQAEGAA